MELASEERVSANEDVLALERVCVEVGVVEDRMGVLICVGMGVVRIIACDVVVGVVRPLKEVRVDFGKLVAVKAVGGVVKEVRGVAVKGVGGKVVEEVRGVVVEEVGGVVGFIR